MTDKKTILVAGATGAQGGSVTRSLIQRGHHVKGLTRSPAKFETFEYCGGRDSNEALSLRQGQVAILELVDLSRPFVSDHRGQVVFFDNAGTLTRRARGPFSCFRRQDRSPCSVFRFEM